MRSCSGERLDILPRRVHRMDHLHIRAEQGIFVQRLYNLVVLRRSALPVMCTVMGKPIIFAAANSLREVVTDDIWGPRNAAPSVSILSSGWENRALRKRAISAKFCISSIDIPWDDP